MHCQIPCVCVDVPGTCIYHKYVYGICSHKHRHTEALHGRPEAGQATGPGQTC